MKLNKTLMFMFLLLVSLISISAIDLDNISFTNEEYFNGAILDNKVVELSNGNFAVIYMKAAGGVFGTICDENQTNCISEVQIVTFTANTLDVIQNSNNGEIVVTIGSGSVSRYYRLNENTLTYILHTTFNGGASDYLSMVQTNSTDFAVAYQDIGDSNKGKIIICKLDASGCGAENGLANSFNRVVSEMKIILNSQNTISILFFDTTSSWLRSTIANLDGTYAGITANVINVGAVVYIDMVEGSDNKLKIVYTDIPNSNDGTFISCDLDGTNCGSPIVYESGSASYNNIVEINTKLFVGYNTGTSNVKNFNLDGSSISATSFFSSNLALNKNVIATSNNTILISYRDFTANKGMFAISEEIPTFAPQMTSNVQPFYNTSNISITLTNNYINSTPELLVEMFYNLDELGNVSLGNTTNITFELTGLNDALHDIIFYLISDQGDSTVEESFTIDTTKPSLIVNLPSEYNFYTSFNFTQYITVSDTNLDSCVITISGESSTICTDSDYDFLTNGNKTINITATDSAGNINSSLNNIMLINPFQSFQIYSDAVQLFNFTINDVSDNETGTVKLTTFNDGLVLGSNSVLFEKLGFASTQINFTLNSTSELNITTNVTESKIVIRIFDRETNTLLTNLTTITIQATTGFNGSTITGLLNVSDINFISEQYQILAEHEGYSTENVFFNYNNQEIINIDIFMLNSTATEAGKIRLIVKNTLSQFVESAVCSALEWRPAESAFVSVGQGLTNVIGETLLNIELNTKIYQFSCTKESFTTITNAQIVQVDESSLTIILNDVILAPTTLFPNLVTSLINTSLNSTHQLITYNFADSDGLTTQACLKVFLVNGNRRTLNQENCVSSSTGTLLLTVDINQTSDILIQGTLTTDQVIGYVTDSITIKGTGDIAGQLKAIGLDVLIPTMLILLGLGLGILLSKIEIAVVFVAIAGWVSVAFVPTIMKSSIAMFISVVVGLMLWGGFNRK